MIDLHTHILPGVDDGAKDMEETLAMCRAAYSDGIRGIVATPHFKPLLFEPPTSELVMKKVSEVNCALKREGIDIEVYSGAEVRLTLEIYDYIESEEFLTINSLGKHMLVEFPMGRLAPGWEGLLEGLTYRGIAPIIAHPERSRHFLDNPAVLTLLVENGVMLQLTADSLLGETGDESKDFCEMLIMRGLAHIIATDTHSLENRRPTLKAATEAAAGLIGMEEAIKLVTTNPRAVVDGEFI